MLYNFLPIKSVPMSSVNSFRINSAHEEVTGPNLWKLKDISQFLRCPSTWNTDTGLLLLSELTNSPCYHTAYSQTDVCTSTVNVKLVLTPTQCNRILQCRITACNSDYGRLAAPRDDCTPVSCVSLKCVTLNDVLNKAVKFEWDKTLCCEAYQI
jgi:hypothetical protein